MLNIILININIFYLGQIQEEVLTGPYFWRVFTQFTGWFDEFYSVYKFPALVALVTTGIVVRTERTRSFHKPVCQESESKMKYVYNTDYVKPDN